MQSRPRIAVRRVPLTEGSILKALLRLSLPIVATTLLQNGYQLVDTFWLGRLGASAMAAVAVSLPITALIVALGIGLSVAGSTLVAQYTGAGESDMVGKVASQTMTMVLILSIIVCAIGICLARSILHLFGAGPEIFEAALRFLQISFLGTMFAFAFSVTQAIFRGIGEVRIPLYIVGGAITLNAVLAPILIFGWGPIAPGGVVGAAISTLIAQVVAAGSGVVALFGPHGIQLHRRALRPEPRLMLQLFKTGLPASIEQSAGTLNYVVMTGLVARFGTGALATYGVGARIHFLMIVPTIAFAMATATLVGQSLGAGLPARAMASAKLSAQIIFATMTVAGVLLFFNAEHLIRLFVPHDEPLIASTALYLKTGAFGLGVTAAHQALAGAYRGAGATATAMMLALLYSGPLQLPLAYLLSRPNAFRVHGLWIATPAANAVICVISIGVFLRGDWLRRTITRNQQCPLPTAADGTSGMRSTVPAHR